VKPAPFSYLCPATVEEALELLTRHGDDARLLAGGQSLLPILNFRLARYRFLIDLNRIAALSYIRIDGGMLDLGAMTRQRAIEASDVVARDAPLLAEATPHIAHLSIRNRGTIGGSLCHADPAAEYPAVMLALDAQMAVASRAGMRTVAASDFFAGPLQTALAPDELLTGIRLPRRQPGQGFAFDEVSRRCGDFALIGVAAALTLRDGVIAQARIAICGLASGVVRAPEVERVLEREGAAPETIGRAATLAASSVVAQSDLHASADYRAHLIEVLTRRVVGRAFRDASPEGGVHG
jgi:aerobic carbon-monoxide dehydrogenase medium subunit